MTQLFDNFISKIIKENQDAPKITGEYWFDEHGNAQYADGDVGDMGHEEYVIQRCINEVLAWFNLDFDVTTDEFAIKEDQIVEIIKDEVGDSWGWDIEDDPARAIIKYLVLNCNVPEDKASDLVFTAYGSSSMDAREYAIKNWNWIRVAGTHIEVNKLNAVTLKNVAKGINDALEQEGDMYEDDSYEKAGQVEYHISTYTGKRYTITLDDMERGNVSGLEEEQVPQVSAATKQVRDMDLNIMPDYYKKKNVIGDSFTNFVNTVLTESQGHLYGWLKPDGEYIPIHISHGDWADKYLQTKGIDTNKIKKYDSIINELFKRGWSRITAFRGTVYCHKIGEKPKRIQSIIDICIENNIKTIEWDNETDDRHILWSNDNHI
jgi:hypothetical protein